MKTLSFSTYSIIVSIFLISISCSNKHSETDLIPFKSEEGFVYVNKKGDTIIKNNNWYYADLFREELARVRSNKEPYRWGFINDKGDTILNIDYQYVTFFNEGIAFVVKDGQPPTAINSKGEKLFEAYFAEYVDVFNEGLAPFSVGSNVEDDFIWGFMNKKGKIVIQPEFYNVFHFAEGLCPVQNKDGDWGYINKKGRLVIDYQFDRAFPFVEETAVVALGDFYGVIDTKGNYLFNPQFEEIQPDGDLFLVQQNDKYGWIDKKGSFVIHPQFEYAYGFNGNELAPVRLESIREWGYINKEGILTIKPRFGYALPFEGNTALIRNGNNFGFIDDKGDSLVEAQFTEISEAYIDHWKSHASFKPGQYRAHTAYFNFEALVDSMKAIISDSVFHSIHFEDTLGNILPKVPSFPAYFPKTSRLTENKIKDYYVTNDAKVSFYLKIKAYDEKQVKRDHGTYSYYDTEYVLNNTIKPEGFTFIFSLNRRGSEMADKTTKEIFEMMKDYELIEEDRYGYKTFRNGKYLYRVGKYYSNGIKIEISKS